MSEEGRFTLELEQQQGFRMQVRFDWPQADALVMDEPPPLGEQQGPNAARLVAAAAANCLSASLLYCLAKEEPPPQSLQTEVTCSMVRNDAKRLRIGGLQVRIRINGELADSKRARRCLELFEEFCVVTASLREGIPVRVEVVDRDGTTLTASE